MQIEFTPTRAERYALAMRAAPDARAAELHQLAAVLHRIGVGRCRTIVELGAGHGFATSTLVNFLAPDGLLLAVDNSRHMAEYIPRHQNVRPLVASLSNLDIGTGTADLVVSLATFHHVTHKTLVMHEVKRVLRAGGHFVIADVNHGSYVQQFFDHVVRNNCSEGHDWDFLDELWVELIARRTGMQHLWSSVEETGWRFASEETMLRFLADLVSLTLDTSELKVLVEEWLHPHMDADGCEVILPWSLGFHVLQTAA